MSEENSTNIDRPQRIAVLGLGCGGIRALSVLQALPAAKKLHLIAIDSDAATLVSLPIPESQQILANVQIRKGRGCGGDSLKGQNALNFERSRIEEMLKNFEYVIVIGGLGGGLASGGASIINSILRKLAIPAVFMLTTPFSWEGNATRLVAERAIEELLPTTDALMIIPNDLLFSVLAPNTPASEAFRLADTEIARSIIAVSEMLTGKNMIPADYADINEALHSKKSFCSIGVGIAAKNESENHGQLAVERMLCSPLLGGAGKLRDADTIIINVLSGTELNIAELQTTMAAANKCYGDSSKVIMAINTSLEYENCILVSAVAIKFAERKKAKPKKHASALKEQTQEPTLLPDDLFAEPEQLTFDLLAAPVVKGIFLNSPHVTFNGEDVDIPTFQRREILIDKGEISIKKSPKK